MHKPPESQRWQREPAPTQRAQQTTPAPISTPAAPEGSAALGELQGRVGNTGLVDALSAPAGVGALWTGELAAALTDTPSVTLSLRSNQRAQAAMRSLPQSFAMPSGSGRPLPAPLQDRLQGLFKHDLSAVRVHDDPASAQAAAQINAQAFAERNHIYFGAGQLDPNNPEGLGRLVHELTHTEQYAQGRLSGKSGLSSPGDATEQEAEAREKQALSLSDVPSTPGGTTHQARPLAHANSPQGLLNNLNQGLGGNLPEQVQSQMLKRLSSRLPQPDPFVEAGDVDVYGGAVAAEVCAVAPLTAPAPAVKPTLPSTTTVSSFDEAFALVDATLHAALDADAATRASRRGASPVAPALAALSSLTQTQAQGEAHGIGSRGERAGGAILAEGEQKDLTPQPAAAPVPVPAMPSGPTLLRKVADEGAGPAPAAPPAQTTPTPRPTPGPAPGPAPTGTQDAPQVTTQAPEAAPVAVTPETVAPVAPEITVEDPLAELDEDLEDLNFDRDQALYEQQRALADLDALKTKQEQAEQKAEQEGHPDEVHGAPPPHDLAAAQDRVNRSDKDVKDLEQELSDTEAERQALANANAGGGGGGGGGGGNGDALAAEAQAQADQAISDASAQALEQADADAGVLAADAEAAKAQLMAQAQTLAADLVKHAEAKAKEVTDAAKEACDKIRREAETAKAKITAEANAAANAAATVYGPFDTEKDRKLAENRAEAEANRLRREGREAAMEIEQACRAKRDAVWEQASVQAQALKDQGALASEQLLASAESGSEALQAQVDLALEQINLNAQASLDGLNAEHAAFERTTRTIAAAAAEAPTRRPTRWLPEEYVDPKNVRPEVLDEFDQMSLTQPVQLGPPGAPKELDGLPSVAKKLSPRDLAPEASPLLTHLREFSPTLLVSGADADAAVAEALGVSPQAWELVQSHPELSSWTALSKAGLSDEDRAALQAASAQHLVSGLDPDEPANLFLSWYEDSLGTRQDYQVTQPHLSNSVELSEPGQDEVAAVMRAYAFERLSISTHGQPGGHQIRPSDGTQHELVDARFLAGLAQETGVQQVILGTCHGAKGADQMNSVDPETGAANASSISEFSDRGIDALAWEGSVLTTHVMQTHKIWGELLAAGIPDQDALALSGAYGNMISDEGFSMNWNKSTAHSKAELGETPVQDDWLNVNGAVETHVNGEKIKPDDMLPLLTQYGPQLMDTPTVKAILDESANPEVSTADIYARMVMTDMFVGTAGSDQTGTARDATMVTKLIKETWSGSPLVQEGKLPPWTTLGPRLYNLLEAQVTAIEQMDPQKRTEYADTLANLQEMRDTVWMQLAVAGEGVTTDSGQMRFLPPDDLNELASTPEATETHDTSPNTTTNSDPTPEQLALTAVQVPDPETVSDENARANDGEPAGPWTGAGEFVNGGVELEATNGHSQTSLAIDGGVEFSGQVPVGQLGQNQISVGPQISYSDGQLQLGAQAGVTRKIGDADLAVLGYATLSVGQGGEVTGFNTGGSAEYGAYSASLAVSFEDADFASYVPSDGTTPGMVFYGHSSGQSLGGDLAVPVGPFVVGADGSLSRGLTVQAFSAVQNLPGLDPTLAQTDPKAYRDAVAAAMAEQISGVDAVNDLSVDRILGWEDGSGMIIEQSAGGSAGGTFGTLAVGVNAGHEDGRTEQVSLQKDGDQVTVTVSSASNDTWRAGFNVGPAGMKAGATDETASSVTFTIDTSTPQGRAALDLYLKTQMLPGALGYAAQNGMFPPGTDLTSPQAVAGMATEANRAFLLSQSDKDTRGGPSVGGATYSALNYSQAFAQSTSLSVLGFEVLNSMNKETFGENLYTVNGEWETNFLYDQQEQWMFSRDTHLSGVSVNPEVGPYLGMYQQMNATHDWIVDNGLTDLLDPNDPLTQLYAAGSLDNRWFAQDPRVSLALGLTEGDLFNIASTLQTQSPANERLSGMDAGVEQRVLNFMADCGDFEFEFDEKTGNVTLISAERMPVGDIAAYAGITPDEAYDLFGDQAGDPMVVAQTLINVVNAEPADFGTLSPLEQELYLRVGLTSYGKDWQALGQTEGSPFDTIDLIAQVQDTETRDALLRRMFYAAEEHEEGAQGTLEFLKWAERLPPDLNARIRDSATLKLDGQLSGPQGVMDEMLSGAGIGIGAVDTLVMVQGLAPEQKDLFLSALPSMINSEAFLTAYAKAHGEPFPYADAGPVAWMFVGMPDAASKSAWLQTLQGTQYGEQALVFAEQHPELFLGQAELPLDQRQAAVTSLVYAGLDPARFGVQPLDALDMLVWDPEAKARFLLDQSRRAGWTDLQAELLLDPTPLLGDPSTRTLGDLLSITDALSAAGMPQELIVNLMARSVNFDGSDYEDALRLLSDGDPQDLADRLFEMRNETDWPGGSSKQDWMTGLLMGAAGDPQTAGAVLDRYVQRAGGDPAAGVADLLSYVDEDPDQLTFTLEVLESAGYSAEVARWRAERGL